MKHETTAISTFPVADATANAGANQALGMAKPAISKCNHSCNACCGNGKDAYARLGDAIKEVEQYNVRPGYVPEEGNQQ